MGNNSEPRIGVFVCHCGKNIAGSVDVKSVTDYASTLDNVVFSVDNTYSCSNVGQDEIKKAIQEHNLNRIVVAACSPRMHEPTFRKTLEEANLNPFLLEFANIREQCSWVHMRDPNATEKAKALVRMAVAKSRHLNPFEKKRLKVPPKALVIGGGVAGIQAALDLSDQGIEVYLVEKSTSLGGHMAQLDKTFPTMDCSICILGPKMVDTSKHKNIKVFTYSEVEDIQGYVGNFKIKIRKKARFVKEDCTGCGVCARFCPIEVPNEFDLGLANRKAIYVPFPQAVPLIYTIDPENCIGCGLCESVCEPKAIDFQQKDEIIEVEVGTIIIATGYDIFDVNKIPEYGYKRYQNVINSLEFERLINASGPTDGKIIRISDGKEPRRIAFIQCVGSRSEKANVYCSGVCCMYSLKHALQIKEKNPEAEVYIFYMDIRAVGKGYEEFYWRAKDNGIKFVRGRPSRIVEEPRTKNLRLLYEDTLAGKSEEMEFDLVILAPTMIPSDIENLRKMLNLSRSPDGFLMEAHPKLRPVDTLTSGIFLAGCVQSPKDIPSSVAQGSAAASRASTLLGKDVEIEPITAFIQPDICIKCDICKEICDFNAIELTWKDVKVNEPLCSGCGACAAACPTKAIQIRNFTDDQIYAQIKEAFEEYDEHPRILAFLCNWCSYAGADTAGLARMQYPSNVKSIRVMCSARVDPLFVLRAFAHGADGVLVAGCHLGDCHYVTGNYKAKRRMEKLQYLLQEFGIEKERLRIEWISASEGEKFARTITEFTEQLKNMGEISKIGTVSLEKVEKIDEMGVVDEAHP
ncbi:MAG TPA: hydrogenase iron-sulfur subunit [Archaeoglobaceae archaeon]|nr:hydrogenase iron-sulfur subunit [Archaeoglobaceae archaeon]